jgi:hypothetical protein
MRADAPPSAPGPMAAPPAPRNPRVVEPAAPITIVLTSGREIHAAVILQLPEPGEDGAALIVEDAAGYVYVMAPDLVEVMAVSAELAPQVLPS